MAQNITLMGASYSAVPAVTLPKTGGGTARFDDASITTATASDVAQGKLFLASDGTITTGTASGGGSTALVLGAIRPDAELVKKVAYDQLAVADEGLTIPAYSTATKTLKTSKSLTPLIELYHQDYNYTVVTRTLAIPIYQTPDTDSGKQVLHCSSAIYEVCAIGDDWFTASGTTRQNVNMRTVEAHGVTPQLAYITAGNKVSIARQAYGAYMTATAPSISTGSSYDRLTLKTPTLYIRGNVTYLNQAHWEDLEDIRYQYVIELYRAPKGNLNYDGWEQTMQFAHIADCWANGGTLT